MQKDNLDEPRRLFDFFKWSILIWLTLIVLFSLQYFLSIESEVLLTLTLLGLIFLGIPITFLSLIEYLKHLTPDRFKGFVSYILLVGFVYLIGLWIDAMLTKEIPFFAFKIVVFVHIILGLYFLQFISFRLSYALSSILGRKLPKFLGYMLTFIIYIAILYGLKLILESNLFLEKIFNFGLQ